MTDLEERLKLLDRIEAPDLWADVRTRDPRRTGEPPSWNRAVAIALAAVVATVGIALLTRAFLDGTPKLSGQPFHPAADANGVIAFVRGTRGPNPGIYVIQPDGTGVRRVAAGAGEYGEATWSPDGSRIAFTRSEGPGSSSVQGLFAAAADGSHARQLLQCGARGCREPAWSPDGRRIAFVWGQDIYTVNADGTDIRRLTRARTPLGDGHPAWSPDGTRIAFIALRVQPDDLPGIFVMNADGSHVRRLTNCLPDCVQSLPAWSPDGRTIAFSGQTDVFVMAATGGPSRKLTDCGSIPDCIDALDPTWSPNGRLIVFEVERDGGRRSLYLMNADGTGLRQLTFHNDDCCASWQPLPSPSSTGHSSVAAKGEIWAPRGIDWDDPLQPYGVTVESSSEAQVPFTPKDPPASVGKVLRIVTSDPSRVEAASREVVWVVQGEDGEFLLYESSSSTTQSQLEDLSSCQPEEVGCSAIAWSLVDIGADGSGLLIDGSQATLGAAATSVTWLEKGVKFVVLGPVDSFAADEATSIAKQIVSG